MLFNSTEFILFLPLVAIAYYITRHRYRWIVLLIASYYFYMVWSPKYTIFIVITTISTYLLALLMDRCNSKKDKKKYLILNLVINLGLLIFFKYLNFISTSFNAIFKALKSSYQLPILDLILPIGISFYTFKALGYTIDVYRGDIKAEKHFGILALFLSFFPQVLSGPIDRASNLLPQFHEKHRLEYSNIKHGLILILWGFFKKIVIADNLAVFVNQIFNSPQNYTGMPLLLAAVFFGIQIYCDFSGYSDTAIGVGKMLGFKFIDNFNRPYGSKSIPEFWRRWHISLSSWFRDYVYIPLGGNRVSAKRWSFNQLVVFLLSGLWHGANWTFVIWGVLHGVYAIASKLTMNIRKAFTDRIGLKKYPKVHSVIRIFITFVLVDFAWIFFRANSISDALYIISNLFTGIEFSLTSMAVLLASLGIGKFNFIVVLLCTAFLFIVEYYQGDNPIEDIVDQKPILLRWTFYYALLFVIILLGGYGYEESTQFIYSQF